ncbi:MAG: NirD/YgiW/YdeI family stress tolerance protein [Desulfovibrionaceae bacterium]|nr:NirD/YgiW/YdeI family stress tolerance protein [Desulfovibrionaceae bacterium]
MRLVLSFLLLTALAVPAYAAFDGPGVSGAPGGFEGPGAHKVTRAAQVRDARDDTPCVLEGHIVSKVTGREDEYMFKDDSGEVVVDIDDKVFGGRRVTPQNRVRLHGEVDTHKFRANDVDVKWMEILK